MKIKTALPLLLLAVSCGHPAIDAGYPIDQVSFTEVEIAPDSFWGEKLQASRDVTIPLSFSKCEESGRYENFRRAANPSPEYCYQGYPFDDTDVYKTLEGASYLLQTYPDPEMDAYMDSIIVLIGKAQEPDGYLNTTRTMNPERPGMWAGKERWSEVENLSHEFYNLGHLLEAAVAHYRATGKRSLLDIGIRYADCVCCEIGDGPGQVARVPGHQIAEMGLAKLYLATGDRKYLDQAEYFLRKRGYTQTHSNYNQSKKPVLEQTEAVGHAVRAEYMYSGMADVAALTGETAYIEAIDRIWDNIVGKKIYLTGGVGARYDGESFGSNYELPNLTSYCETCAAVAHVYFAYRMFLLHGDSSFYDVLERTLYNGVLSGISADGGAFFYPNPLESDGSFLRQPWFGCACCPSNICRFIPSVPGYFYAAKGRDFYVNLFCSNTVSHNMDGGLFSLEQHTAYPWDGEVSMTVKENRAGKLRLCVRVPGWARSEAIPGGLYRFEDSADGGWSLLVNNEHVECSLENGYACVERRWKKGDSIVLKLDMPARVVKADDAVEADRGRFALQRGPLVFCAEEVDNTRDVVNTAVDPQARILTLDGGHVLQCDGMTLVPYYSWNNRGKGKMAVWLKEKE